MCTGLLMPKMPQIAQPKRQAPPPSMKAAAPPSENVDPERIKEEGTGEDKIATKKKKALEIKKVKEGVKKLGSIDPKTLPNSPDSGVTPPT